MELVTWQGVLTTGFQSPVQDLPSKIRVCCDIRHSDNTLGKVLPTIFTKVILDPTLLILHFQEANVSLQRWPVVPDNSDGTIILQKVVSNCWIDSVPSGVTSESTAISTIREWPVAARVSAWNHISDRAVLALAVSDLSHELCEERTRIKIKAFRLRRKG